jgi:hypothetical protein
MPWPNPSDESLGYFQPIRTYRESPRPAVGKITGRFPLDRSAPDFSGYAHGVRAPDELNKKTTI